MGPFCSDCGQRLGEPLEVVPTKSHDSTTNPPSGVDAGDSRPLARSFCGPTPEEEVKPRPEHCNTAHAAVLEEERSPSRRVHFAPPSPLPQSSPPKDEARKLPA